MNIKRSLNFLIASALVVLAVGVGVYYRYRIEPTAEIWVVNAGRTINPGGFGNVTDEAYLSRIYDNQVLEKIPIHVGSLEVAIYRDKAYVVSFDASPKSSEELRAIHDLHRHEEAIDLAVNLVQVLDLKKKKVIKEFSSHGKLPTDVVISNSRIFIVNRYTANVAVLSLQGNLLKNIEVGLGAHAMGVAPNGLVFVTNGKENTVSVIDPRKLVELKRIPVGTNPQTVAFRDDIAYVLNGPRPNKAGEPLSVFGEPLTKISLADLNVLPSVPGELKFSGGDIIVDHGGSLLVTSDGPRIVRIDRDGNVSESERLYADQLSLSDGRGISVVYAKDEAPNQERVETVVTGVDTNQKRVMRLLEANNKIYATLYDAGVVIELDYNLNILKRYAVGSGVYGIAVREINF